MKFVALLCTLATAILLSLPSTVGAQGPMPVNWRFTSIGNINSVAYSPDGTLIAVGGYSGVEIYSASTGQAVRGLAAGAFQANGLVFSPDGTKLLVAGSTTGNGSVQLWNVSDGTLAESFPTAIWNATSCAFSPDGKTFALGGAIAIHGVVEIWNVATKSRQASLSTTSQEIDSVAFSPDGTTLVDGGRTSSKGVLETWRVADSHLVLSLNTAAVDVVSLAISPDGKTLAAAGNGPYVRGATLELWNLTSATRIAELATTQQWVNAVAFSPDGKTIADTETTMTVGYKVTISWNSVISTWSAETGAPIAQYAEGNSVGPVSFSPDGQKLACGTSGSLQTFSSNGLSLISSNITGGGGNLLGYPSPVFSPDGETVLGGAPVHPGGAANLWNAVNGTWLTSFVADANQNGPTWAYSPDGKTIAAIVTSYNGGYVQFFDARTLALLSAITMPNFGLYDVCYSPDGTKLAVPLYSTSFTNVVQIWDISTGKLLSTLDTASNGDPNPIAFSPDGSLIVLGGQLGGSAGVLELWNASTGALISSLPTKVNKVLGVAFSPDGKQLAAAGQATPQTIGNPFGMAELWDVKSQQLSATLPLTPGTGSAQTPLYSADGKSLFLGSDAGVQVFSPSTHSMLGYFFNDGYYLALSPDGTTLAYTSASNDLVVGPVPTIYAYAIANLAFNPKTVAGGAVATGTVTLVDPAPAGGVVIGINVHRPMSETRSTVLVPAGALSATFPVTTYTQDSQTSLVVIASSGPNRKTVSLMVTPFPPLITSFTTKPATIIGGNYSQLYVDVASPAIGSEIPIYLTSNCPAVPVAASVILFQGNNQASNAIYTSPVSVKTVARLTATLGGSTKTTTLTLLPATMTQFVLNPTEVQAGIGSTGTITLNGMAGPQGMMVQLSSSSPYVKVPATVVVAPRATKATFVVTTVATPAQVTATITAKAGTVSLTATLILNPFN